MKIKKVIARQIIDSRGNPTIECELHSQNNIAIEQVPSGASTGIHEALELRDNDENFHGKGVLRAVLNIKKLSKEITEKNFRSLKEFDYFLIKKDGSENKSVLGANTILALSLGFARLHAKEKNLPLYKYISKIAGTKPQLPIPFMNVINGGKHAEGKLKFQEFMIVPLGHTFKDSLRMGVEVYQTLKKLIEEKYGVSSSRVGDEGGFAPNLKSAKDALNLLIKAIHKQGYTGKIKIAIDAAASEFYENHKYLVDGKKLTPHQLLSKYRSLITQYPIISIEDPFDQEDFLMFAELLRKEKINVVGDDLTVTNKKRIEIAIAHRSCNVLLLKLNQIGTVTEAIEAAKLAFQYKWKVMVSHRSGETESTFISDLAVGLGCGMIKSGAPARTERTAKYNQLLRIEEQVKNYKNKL